MLIIIYVVNLYVLFIICSKKMFDIYNSIFVLIVPVLMININMGWINGNSQFPNLANSFSLCVLSCFNLSRFSLNSLHCFSFLSAHIVSLYKNPSPPPPNTPKLMAKTLPPVDMFIKPHPGPTT